MTYASNPRLLMFPLSRTATGEVGVTRSRQRQTDFTIAPQTKSAILFNVSWLLDKRKGTIENNVVGKGLLIDDVGVSRDTVVSQGIRPGADFETGDLVKEELGGLPWNDSAIRFEVQYEHGLNRLPSRWNAVSCVTRLRTTQFDLYVL